MHKGMRLCKTRAKAYVAANHGLGAGRRRRLALTVEAERLKVVARLAVQAGAPFRELCGRPAELSRAHGLRYLAARGAEDPRADLVRRVEDRVVEVLATLACIECEGPLPQ